MEKLNKEQYFDLIKDFSFVPFTQSRAWLEFTQGDDLEKVLFLVDSATRPQIACFAHIKKAFGFSMLWIEGESMKSKTINQQIIEEFYKSLSALPFHVIEINSTLPYHADYEIGIRQAGYLRPQGLISTPLTIMVSLDKEIVFNRNWERNLKKASELRLSFEVLNQPNERTIKTFVSMYNAMAKFKGFSYQVNEKSIARLLQNPDMKIFQLIDEDGDVSCMRIVFLHKNSATDVFAANSLKSRTLPTTNALVQEILLYLKSVGCKDFDFARILVGQCHVNSVYQFKNGVKGEKLLYAGEWSFTHKPFYRRIAFLIKKYWMKRAEI